MHGRMARRAMWGETKLHHARYVQEARLECPSGDGATATMPSRMSEV